MAPVIAPLHCHCQEHNPPAQVLFEGVGGDERDDPALAGNAQFDGGKGDRKLGRREGSLGDTTLGRNKFRHS